MSESIESFLKSCRDFKAENGGFDRIIGQSAQFIPDHTSILGDEFQVSPISIERWGNGKSIPSEFAQRGIVSAVAEIVGRQLEPERRELKADELASDLDTPRERGLEP